MVPEVVKERVLSAVLFQDLGVLMSHCVAA